MMVSCDFPSQGPVESFCRSALSGQGPNKIFVACPRNDMAGTWFRIPEGIYGDILFGLLQGGAHS